MQVIECDYRLASVYRVLINSLWQFSGNSDDQPAAPCCWSGPFGPAQRSSWIVRWCHRRRQVCERRPPGGCRWLGKRRDEFRRRRMSRFLRWHNSAHESLPSCVTSNAPTEPELCKIYFQVLDVHHTLLFLCSTNKVCFQLFDNLSANLFRQTNVMFIFFKIAMKYSRNQIYRKHKNSEFSPFNRTVPIIYA